MNARCPAPGALERAYFEDDEVHAAHVAICPTCASAWREIGELHAVARTLEVANDGADRRESLRERITAPVRRAGPRWRSPMALAAGLAAGFIAAGALLHALFVEGPTAEKASFANLRILDTARFERVHGPPDEIVHLHSGALAVDVEPLASGERFRILTGDGEVEVHGTAFEVRASDDRLVSVAVTRGAVLLRRGEEAPRLLSPGTSWAASAPEQAEDPRSRPTAPATRNTAAPIVELEPGVRDAAVPREQAAAPSPDDTYERGWAALRASSFSAAAKAFAEAKERGRTSEIREDAAFFLGVALAREGRSKEAADALESFLSTYESSARMGEAAAMLGWIRLEDGDRDRARSSFERAKQSRNKRAMESAANGLEALDAGHPRRKAPASDPGAFP